jgi:hypothetical protein
MPQEGFSTFTNTGVAQLLTPINAFCPDLCILKAVLSKE